jgi:hypothetical protein
MKFPRYKAKYFDKRLDIAFEFSKPLLEKLMNESMQNKISDEDFKRCKEITIEASFAFADGLLKKASEK